MLMKAVRVALGQLIIVADTVTRPRKMRRTQADQKIVDKATSSLSLYQFHACPFCVRTRRTMRRLNLPIALHDIKKDAQARDRLLAGGGKIKVPCLRIEEDGKTTWMYESKVIMAYLQSRFGPGIGQSA
jgi:glutaredoxin